MTAINAQGYRQVAVLRVWFGVDGSDLEDVSESTKYEMGMNQILDSLKVFFFYHWIHHHLGRYHLNSQNASNGNI